MSRAHFATFKPVPHATKGILIAKKMNNLKRKKIKPIVKAMAYLSMQNVASRIR